MYIYYTPPEGTRQKNNDEERDSDEARTFAAEKDSPENSRTAIRIKGILLQLQLTERNPGSRNKAR